MEVLQEILNRRSIRKFKNQEVSNEIVKQLLRAAMQAPSANNEQPWEFIVVNKKEILEKISEVHPYAKMAKEAAVAIIVCGDLKKEVSKGRWVQDCSAAIENILLEAVHQRLGAVWVGVYPRKEREDVIRQLFNLPPNIIPLAIIPIGYPNEDKRYEDRYKEERVHYNEW